MRHSSFRWLPGLVALPLLVNAQDLRVDDLHAVSSPATTILGVQPAEIARPKSYKALETALLTNFSSGSSWQIPVNYALEVTPYWFKPRDISVRQLMNPTTGASLKQSFSISVATGRRASLLDSTRTIQQIGFGLRATLFPGQLTTAFDTDLAALTSRIAIIAPARYILEAGRGKTFANGNALRAYLDKEFGIVINDRITDKAYIRDFTPLQIDVVESVLLGRYPENNAQCQLLLGQMILKLSDYDKTYKLAELAKKVERHYYFRKGFRMDVAAASSVEFPTNDFDYSTLAKYGIWATPGGSWIWNNVNLEVLGLVRFMSNQVVTDPTRNWDVGSRVAANWRRLSLSIEYIHRFQNTTLQRTSLPTGQTDRLLRSDQDYRLAMGFEYHLSDRFVLAYALGRNFSLNTEFNGNLISILSFNAGLSGPTVKIAD